MMKALSRTSIQKLIAIITTLALIAAANILVPPAFAEDAQLPQGQTGSGNTSLVLHVEKSGEFGGAGTEGEFANPDLDGDGLGDNLAFTVPTRIDFLASPDGTLTGPDPNVVYIENESVYSVHVSSLQVSPLNAWNIVADASASQLDNSIDILVGPESDQLNAASYLSKSAVGKPAEWNMGPRTSEGASDRIPLVFSGHVSNVVHDLSQEMAFGQIQWYVTPGLASGE